MLTQARKIQIDETLKELPLYQAIDKLMNAAYEVGIEDLAAVQVQLADHEERLSRLEASK